MATFNRALSIIVGVGAIGGISGACAAQSTPLTLERELRMETFAGGFCNLDRDTLQAVAPEGFDDWSETLSNTSSACGASITGLATMQSAVSTGGILAAGRVEHWHPSLNSKGTVGAECWHVLRYTFSVPGDTPYTLAGFLQGGGSLGDSFRSLAMRGDGEPVFSRFGSFGSFDQEGVLAAGEYSVEITLMFDYRNFSSQEEASGSLLYEFDLSFEGPEPCPCDWTPDWIVNSQDFFDFMTAFFAGDADLNANGVTDSQDFFDFLACFFAGCG